MNGIESLHLNIVVTLMLEVSRSTIGCRCCGVVCRLEQTLHATFVPTVVSYSRYRILRSSLGDEQLLKAPAILRKSTQKQRPSYSELLSPTTTESYFFIP